MVTPGLRDWWLQRISATFISAFGLPLLVMWYGGWLPDEVSWYTFLSSPLGQVLTVVGVIGIAVHSQLGLWVVVTDYVPRRAQRLVSYLVNAWILALVVWAAYLIWMIR